ncbi:hypothetical protein AAGW05_01975 [Arthrobacter sp. LAPM80]|uniref:hypothetical protein n=1 Tax=Arthrobacter sp. LAPM80 TaxID=3141788 RepID=UPI00398B8C77
MSSSLQLGLMVGPAIPIPVPPEIVEALVSVEITERDVGPSAFTLQFTMSNSSILPTLFILSGGSPFPIIRVVLSATLNGSVTVLADGVVTQVQVMPGSDAAHSILQVTGEDLSKLMDKLDLTGLPFPAMPAEAAVALVLAKYLALGVLPVIVPSIMLDVPIPTDRIPAQQGTDLKYITALAAKVGYVFYVAPGPIPGTSTAYWGPRIKVGAPQTALNMDMDAFTNTARITFTYQPQKAVMPIVFIQNQQTHIPLPIPIPPITPLNPPLGLVNLPPSNTKPLKETAKYTPVQAILTGIAAAANTADTVEGKGSLDVLRYGRILTPRSLVGVRGAGLAFDGLYYVSEVKHSIKAGEFMQNFTLSRNGLISTVPTVAA